jgi:hypothetical protein
MWARTGRLGAPLVAVVLLAGCGGSSSGSEELRLKVQHKILTEGGAQLKAGNPTTRSSPTARDTIEDVNCAEAGTGKYACLTHYRVNDPSRGINSQSYSININAACTASGKECTFSFGNAR